MSVVEMSQAVLPQAVFLPVWVKVSWALVVSAVVLRLTPRLKVSLWLASVVSVVMLLPHTSASGYLALAFQTPSLVLVAWAIWCWADVLQMRSPVATTPTSVAWMGVLLGWALVVDTLNYWPAWFNPQLYALGFMSAGLWLVLAACAVALLWVQPPKRWVFSVVVVLAAYVLLRLPTGNVWDAVLDPFVWLTLHVQLLRAGCTWHASGASSTGE